MSTCANSAGTPSNAVIPPPQMAAHSQLSSGRHEEFLFVCVLYLIYNGLRQYFRG